MIIVSACLAGINSCYDGENALSSYIRDLVEEGKAVPACPEQLGGLPTPREPAEINSGDGSDVLDGRARVKTPAGLDVTQQYIHGAEEFMKILKLVGAVEAILKTKSPACGIGKIYRNNQLVEGNGVCAVLLARHGIKVVPMDQDRR